MTVPSLSRRSFVAGGLAALVDLSAFGQPSTRPDTASPPPLPDIGGEGPWDYWASGQGAGVVRIAAAAILSASPYDTQPWLFRLRSTHIEVLADKNRNLGELDPFRRELYMGLGCAIENACVAAPAQGFNPVVRLLPESPAGNDNLAAAIELRPARQAKHPYHDAIARRHTNRLPYDTDRKIDQATLDALAGLASSADVQVIFLEATSPGGTVFTDLMMQATQLIIDTPDLREGRWAGLRAIAANPSALSAEALQRADANWLKATRTVACATAAAFGLIMVRGTRQDHRLHIEAGRLWQRIHLDGTNRDLAMQPMNHFVEVIDHETRTLETSRTSSTIRAALQQDWNGWEPIFGFRLGYAGAMAPRSPRRPLSSIVVT
ncbi:hypothetical protein R69608_07313 [Paraburkholderia nemoris]|uniref:Twin-arginine translocation pathway signal protein n=2 Tax=Paraburkholderia TaxID=1822464 RepID=A0ABM8T2K9_9BURK|nr:MULTISPECIES: hypothetical protein [Paraburkholderia]MBK5152768.1 hypothetical protein [Burkholderia sp. R-69608]CAE6872778.1 hypothetical protein R69749_06358 [Paraburkholderia domus]MBK3815766.1 hypothetical protein [Paraburkholderia aspalathi]CAE6850077.1 hypothetical protein R69776_07454 [Paraburkholderia nemoris]CAE6970095.1 hypothetical protein R69608_07313 [Paraburkholderia nemoris]